MSNSVLRESLAGFVINKTIADETLDDVVSTVKDYLQQSFQFDPTTKTYTAQNSHVHCEALLLLHNLFLLPVQLLRNL